MKTCDWVITNPPFDYSSFKPFVEFLISSDIDFIIWAPTLGLRWYLNDLYVFNIKQHDKYDFRLANGQMKAMHKWSIAMSKKPPYYMQVKKYSNIYKVGGIITLTAAFTFCKDDYYHELADIPNTFIRIKVTPKNK